MHALRRGRTPRVALCGDRLARYDEDVDLRLLISTFTAIFIAELGDKTQLAIVSLSAGSSGSRWTVLLGATLALVTSTALAVLAGELVARYVSPLWMHRIAGAVFIILGALYLFRGGVD